MTTTLAQLQQQAARTELEDTLAFQLRSLGLPKFVREYRFDPNRRWRFDMSWPDLLLAVEVDGGTRTGGRHVRGDGYQKDCDKLNAATLQGWRILRFTADDVHTGRAAQVIAQALKTLP